MRRIVDGGDGGVCGGHGGNGDNGGGGKTPFTTLSSCQDLRHDVSVARKDYKNNFKSKIN